jgi:hypothetical protein
VLLFHRGRKRTPVWMCQARDSVTDRESCLAQLKPWLSLTLRLNAVIMMCAQLHSARTLLCFYIALV